MGVADPGEQFNKRMAFSLSKRANYFPFSGLLRHLERDVETVIKILQPGSLGIIEHKFSAEEIHKANATVKRAVENWRTTAKVEQHSPVLRDFISK